jgi:hypothetical protein
MSNKQLRPNNALHSDPTASRRRFPRSLLSLGAGERGRYLSKEKRFKETKIDRLLNNYSKQIPRRS